MTLKIIGRLAEKSTNQYKKILEYNFKEEAKEILLFCDFAEFEIPQNHQFNFIQSPLFKERTPCLVTLKCITQQYLLRFEFIPKGWKTVCKFEFQESESSNLFDILPQIDDWEESENSVLIIDE